MYVAWLSWTGLWGCGRLHIVFWDYRNSITAVAKEGESSFGFKHFPLQEESFASFRDYNCSQDWYDIISPCHISRHCLTWPQQPASSHPGVEAAWVPVHCSIHVVHRLNKVFLLQERSFFTLRTLYSIYSHFYTSSVWLLTGSICRRPGYLPG